MKTINIRNEEEWRGTPFLCDAVYGTLDVMMTHAADTALDNLMRPAQALVHDFNLALQPAAMLTTIRGARVDHVEAQRFRSRYSGQLARLEKYISGMTLKELGWELTLQKSDYGSLDLIDAFFGLRDPSTCKECGGAGRVITQSYVAPEPIPGQFFKSGARKGEQKMTPGKNERSKKCGTRHTRPGFELPKPKLAWDAKTNTPSVDKDVLGGIVKRETKNSARRLARAILLRRNIKKLSDTVRQITNAQDGRFHPHFGFGNTKSHRANSKRSNMGENTNGENITKYLRRLLIADPGFIILQGDICRAESHILAARAKDPAYLAAHEGDEDTHTIVARMCWPHLNWLDDPSEAERFAKTTVFDPSIPRGKLRDVSKVVQHARGRDGSKRTVGQALGTGDNKGQEVIDVFDAAFPRVPAYIREAWEALKVCGYAECEELGIMRKFFANPANHATLRDLLAFVLQAPVAYVCHLAFWRIYRHLDTKSFYPAKGDVQLLFHNHDAVVVQVREAKVDQYLPLLDQALTTPLVIWGREVVLRRDWEIGSNWRDLKSIKVQK